MGVSNFKKILNYLCCWEEVKIEKVDVIIDGNALYYFLYFNSDPKLDQCCGGDYPGFKDEVCKFFKTLKDCKVNPYVIVDGASVPDKHKAGVSRFDNKLDKAKKIAMAGPNGTLQEEVDVLPPLVKDVFIEILREEGIKFKVCLGEADPEVVSEANTKQCAVLSKDTDFCIYKLHKGFLHLDNFLWKNKEDGKIPAKLYRRSQFCKLYKLDPTLMLVFASLAGNDYSNYKEKYKFGEQSQINDPSVGNEIKILDGILHFLSRINPTDLTHSQKIRKALDYLKDSKILGKENYEIFKASIEKYDKVETQHTNSKLPSWLLEKVKNGTLTSFVISVVDHKTMTLTPLVEDFLQCSSYTAAYRIRQYFYGLLTEDEVTEYDRDGENKVVQPTDEQQQLDLKCPPTDNRLCHRVFEQALQFQTSDLENISQKLKLPVCVTVFWFKTLQDPQKPEIVNCLHALLLWFVCEPDGPEDDFERRMKALKDEGVSNWQPCVAHAFSQWQCCMRQSLHLNQLLCCPLPEPQCARLYCGPLLHRLAVEDTIKQLEKTLNGQKEEIYKKLKTILNPTSTGEGSSG